MIDFKRMLQELLSGEDFSDHSTGLQDGHAPLHDEDACNFCDAWRSALIYLTINLRPQMFAGETVAIGDVTGIVESVNVIYDVRLTGTDGERRYGRFASQYVKPVAPTPANEPQHLSDRDGDIWKIVGEKTLALCDMTGEPQTGKREVVHTQAYVEENYGPLVPVKP